MAYVLNEITIRTNNEDMQKIEAVWRDVTSGKLPILFDSERVFQKGVSPVSRYSNYASDENGAYDLSIMGVTPAFFRELEEQVYKGIYKKYDECGGEIGACIQKAWAKVWREQKDGAIKRAFASDFESSVPAAYTKDGKAHCYLYISLAQNEQA